MAQLCWFLHQTLKSRSSWWTETGKTPQVFGCEYVFFSSFFMFCWFQLQIEEPETLVLVLAPLMFEFMLNRT